MAFSAPAPPPALASAASEVAFDGHVLKRYSEQSAFDAETKSLKVIADRRVRGVPRLMGCAFPFALLQGRGQAVQPHNKLSVTDWHDLIDTLQDLHERAGLVHCDVRSSNLVYATPTGSGLRRILLIDFHNCVPIGAPVTGNGTPLCAADDQLLVREGLKASASVLASATVDLQAVVRMLYAQVRGVRRQLTNIRRIAGSDVAAAPALRKFWADKEFADSDSVWAKMLAAASAANYVTLKELLRSVAFLERE